MSMHPSVDYDRVASTYDRRYRHNDYSGIETALVAFAGQDLDHRVLEVGCGTGHWLRLLGGRAIWVAGWTHPPACWRRPGRRRSCTAGLSICLGQLSLSIASCASTRFIISRTKPTFLAEARRVLRPGGRMMTIGLDPNAGTDQWYIYDYFEPVLENDRRRYPAASQIQEWMDAVQFVDCVTREVQHLPARLSARTAIEQGRLDKGATSQLSVLTDEQYQQGISRIRKGIESAEALGESLDLTADLRLYATFGSVP